MRRKKQQDQPEPEKEPIDMNTDEALEYVFGPELTEQLKQEVRQFDGDPDCQNGDN